jgi:hypothetical protein
MNADRKGTLPAPHQGTAVNVTAWSGTHFTVDYIARPRELLPAGPVTAHMEGKILHQRSGIHMDEAGRGFTLAPISPCPKPPKRVLWASAELIALRFQPLGALAPQLSGCSSPGSRACRRSLGRATASIWHGSHLAHHRARSLARAFFVVIFVTTKLVRTMRRAGRARKACRHDPSARLDR